MLPNLSHVPGPALRRECRAWVVRESAATAQLLAHLAELDARREYLPAGYHSMFAYCVGELELSEDATLKRLQAMRAIRQYPVLFDALAEGHLHSAGSCSSPPT